MTLRHMLMPVPRFRVLHYASHRGLVRSPASGGSLASAVSLDAIVVPTNRPAEYLRFAADLASRAHCRLVVLTSGEAVSPGQVVETVGGLRRSVKVTAVEVPKGYSCGLLRPATDGHAIAVASSTGDLGPKRNLGLLLGRMMGWRHILFLDDDVRASNRDGREPEDGFLHRMLTPFRGDAALDAVGWAFLEDRPGAKACFDDNSVVCHSARLAGCPQSTFIGGGALAVRLGEGTPFFPRVYNEDWLFLFDLVGRESVVLAGELWQFPQDPYARPELAVSQEFGDLLGEGLYRLFHERRSVDEAGRERYWRDVIELRRRFIGRIVACLENGTPWSSQRWDRGGFLEMAPASVIDRATVSLQAAMASLDGGWSHALAEYVGLWRADLHRWGSLMSALPQVRNLDEALRRLGLDAHAVHRRHPGRGARRSSPGDLTLSTGEVGWRDPLTEPVGGASW